MQLPPGKVCQSDLDSFTLDAVDESVAHGGAHQEQEAGPAQAGWTKAAGQALQEKEQEVRPCRRRSRRCSKRSGPAGGGGGGEVGGQALQEKEQEVE